MTTQNIVIILLFFIAFMASYFALVNYYSLEQYMSTEHNIVSRVRTNFNSEVVSTNDSITFSLYPTKEIDTNNLFVNYSIIELPWTKIKQVEDKKLDTIAENEYFQIWWEREAQKNYQFSINIYNTNNETIHKEKISLDFLSKNGTERITSELLDQDL